MSVDHLKSWKRPPVAVLWDQSLVWGLICIDTLDRMSIPYHLLSGTDVAHGGLESYRVLVVPGGWAAHKVRALGEGGKKRLSAFIDEGGGYIGFCGGAGMALTRQPSLGLVPLERMGLSERLPNASGQVIVRGMPGHPAWLGLPEAIPVSIWWPSQFAWHPLPRSFPLASYLRPGEDFTIADLPFADLKDLEVPWHEWESIYGINLNPVRLMGHPAMMELRRGKGRLILSYPHLETPGDDLANRLFANILGYLSDSFGPPVPSSARAGLFPCPSGPPPSPQAVGIMRGTEERVRHLIAFGERHLLWNWRKPWLLQWRRGIRGLEYGMLAVVMRRVVWEAEACGAVRAGADPWLDEARGLDRNVQDFCRLAERLLLEEKVATQNGQLSKLGNVNATVNRLRRELFGEKMSHAGLCRMLFDDLDRMLLGLLRHRTTHPETTRFELTQSYGEGSETDRISTSAVTSP
jgi:hypothetical protein